MARKKRRGRPKGSKNKRKVGRRKKKKTGRKAKGQIPLDILERRLGSLNAVVKRRGGEYYG